MVPHRQNIHIFYKFKICSLSFKKKYTLDSYEESR